MSGEKYGSKTDVVVKLVLVFFIALLSFSIGTFVGKKFSDNQYKLSQLEPQNGHSEETANNSDDSAENAENRGIASIPANAGDMKPDKALTDDEIAKLASEFVSDDEGTKKQEVKPTTAAVGADLRRVAMVVPRACANPPAHGRHSGGARRRSLGGDALLPPRPRGVGALRADLVFARDRARRADRRADRPAPAALVRNRL